MTSILEKLFAQHVARRDCVAIVAGEERITWGELETLSRHAASCFRELAAQRVGVVHVGNAASWAALAALDQLRADVFLLDAATSDHDVARLVADFRLAAVVRPSESKGESSPWCVDSQTPSPGSGESSVTILTSGTSGRPKAARHTWASLGRPVRAVSNAMPAPWLLTYRPQLYAGLQVCLQCFASGETLVLPVPGASAEHVAELMVRERVACVSATPSYWRNLLFFAPAETLAQIDLRQITLGGEIVDQAVLDQLASRFPKARIAHIYATTELGRCFSVTDGRAGFPSHFLDSVSPDGVELRVEGGQLLVRSSNAMRQYDDQSNPIAMSDQWFATGDLIRCEGDRCYFVGRESDIINVGGNKVSPQEIEQVLRSVPGVADVRVYGKPSSMVGQLVAAEIVPHCAQDSDVVKSLVLEQARERLATFQRPRVVEIVPRIELTDAGKIRRR